MKIFPAIISVAIASLTLLLSCTQEDAPAQPDAQNQESELVAITGIGFDQTELTLEQGGTASLTVVFTPADTDDTNFDLEYQPSLLDIDRTGTKLTLTALAAGSVTVVVHSLDNEDLEGSCLVTIN